MSETPLVESAHRWVVEKYSFNSRHLLQSLVWIDRLAPGSREAVRLATLTHDMERAFPGPDSPVAVKLDDEVYYKAHSERSARIVGAWLREQDADTALVSDVEALIRVHEFGGWPEANFVQAADSLSFLDTNIDLFLGFARSGQYPASEVKVKFDFTYDRIQIEEARTFARPLYETALARLAALEAEMTAAGREPVGARR